MTLETKTEAAQNILRTLNGFSYSDAFDILELARKNLRNCLVVTVEDEKSFAEQVNEFRHSIPQKSF